MIHLERIIGAENILNLLIMFKDVFSRLEDRVSNLSAYSQKLDVNANVYAGKYCDNIFGIVIFYANNLDTRTAYISLIGVKKEYEHKGLGKWLLEKCIEISKETGMNRVRLEVDLDNRHAIEFYKKNGMTEKEQTDRKSMYMEIEI